MAGSFPDSSGAPVGVGEVVVDEEGVDDAGDCGGEFAACVAEGCDGGVCLVFEC